MTKATFYDDTKEILVWNTLDHIYDTLWRNSFWYNDIANHSYKELVNMLNTITVEYPLENKEQWETYMINYNKVINQYIKKETQPMMRELLQIKNDKIIVPIKLYVILSLNGLIKCTLDTLWYYAQPTYIRAEKFREWYEKKLVKKADFITRLVSMGNYEQKFFFDEEDYNNMKREFWHLENNEMYHIPEDPTIKKFNEILYWIQAKKQGTPFQPVYTTFLNIHKLAEKTDVLSQWWEWQHYSLDYIIFLYLFTDKKPCLVITKDYWNVEVWYWSEIFLSDTHDIESLYIRQWMSTIIINSFFSTDTLVQHHWSKNIMDIWKEKYKEININKDISKDKMNKLIKYMTEQLRWHNKTEFYINTKHQQPDAITTIITQSDPKRFRETEQSIEWNIISIEEKPLPKKWKQRIYKSKTKL